MTANCVYRFVEPATLRVELTATTDKATIVNLTQHAYFNLDGSPDILDHELHARLRLLYPGRRGTDPDRRDPRRRRDAVRLPPARPIRNAAGQTYDINFVASRAPGPDGLAWIATLRSPKNGLTLELHSTEPGVQIYDAAKLELPGSRARRRPLRRARGLLHGAAGLSQTRPTAAISAACVLRPDEEYRHVSEFRFRVTEATSSISATCGRR